MIKLGCYRLNHTHYVKNGGMSSRQTQRYLVSRVLPNFNIGLTTSLDDQGKSAIEKNMEALIGNEVFSSLIELGEKYLVYLLVDGVAVDKRMNVDFSQMPHQFTGLCLHYPNTNFITFADAQRIESSLDKEGDDMSKIHLAKEAKVWCIGLNHHDITTLFPVAILLTCKKDYETEEPTHSVLAIAKVIYDKYHSMKFPEKVDPLSGGNSDGAAPFCNGMGWLLCKDLSSDIR